VTGRLGAPPAMIPLDLTFVTGSAEKKLHFELVNHPKLTPLLVALTTFNGISQNRCMARNDAAADGRNPAAGHVPVQVKTRLRRAIR